MAKLSDSNIFLRKNLIINGDFRIHQRDNNKTNIGNGDSGYAHCDRWRFTEAGAIGSIFTIGQDVVQYPTLSGFKSSLKIDVTTAEAAVGVDEVVLIEQRIEAQDLQHLMYGESTARDVTLSFWILSTSTTGTMGVALNQNDAVRCYIQDIAVTDSWVKHELTFPGDTSGVITDDTGIGLRVSFCIFGGSNYQATADQWNSSTDFCTSSQTNFADSTATDIHIAGVQLEVGSRATEFEFRPVAIEQKLCERYFEKSYNINTNVAANPDYSGSWGVTPCRAGTDYREDVRFRTRKRVAPTLTFYSPESGASGKIRNTTAGSNIDFAIVDIGETGACDHNWGTATVDGNRYQGHYTADAEL